jgi:regulator of protease activity HflC (stomatin/prohibitin superfamily)
MEQNLQRNNLVNLFILLLAAVAAFAVSRYGDARSGQVAASLLFLGVLVAAVTWFHAGLEERERIEKLEFDELTKGSSSSTLFHTQEAEAFLARRSREQFEKFFVPGFTVLLMLLEAGAFWWFWRWLDRQPAAAEIKQPLVTMAIAGLVGLVCFLIGKYSAGLSQLQGVRLLNPSASHLLLGAYLLWLVVAAVAAYEAGFALTDFILARAFCCLLALLVVENLLTLLLEIYRPRVKGGMPRLLYESRLVGVISHPESLFTTAAHALDYQFGFKVSETWFYQFLRRAAVWLVLSQLAILALSTCFVYIETGEAALFERWGKPVNNGQVFGPGIHPKWPWPVTKAYRYRTDQIQSLNIGFDEVEEEPHEEVATLWTVSHLKTEFNLLVASREPVDASTSTNAAGRKAPPVNLLSAGIPVQFQITNLTAWAYNYADSGKLLKDIATREVVRYLVGADLNELMSTGRFAAGQALQQRIQAGADELRLGAKVLFVGMADVHPPVPVGAAFERVVGAQQVRQAEILKAEAAAIRTNALAAAEAARRRNQADAAAASRISAARANTSLFTNQLAAFRSSPEVYVQRVYLQALSRYGREARKFILATTNSQEVLMLNMEDKVSDALLRAPLPTPKK